MQVEAVADLTLLDNEVLRLFGLDNTAGSKDELGIKVAVKCLCFNH